MKRWLLRFWRRQCLGLRRWLVFTATETFTVDGPVSPPKFERETARVEVYW